ncbi:MAG TPA: hypothetical protein DET40_25940 [Lentisphaeria bacterium]|nr:MAG: hypothetical protein A2X45_15030 [Lentisphaerae bacterium GWF2_50_93]HCE47004.1 hypothetical protein [Lentisphaeria bacterium]
MAGILRLAGIGVGVEKRKTAGRGAGGPGRAWIAGTLAGIGGEVGKKNLPAGVPAVREEHGSPAPLPASVEK